MARTPYDFGAKGDGLTDDTDALGRWVTAGGGDIPRGIFRFNGPLRFEAGFKIERWEGKLLYGRGWPSGYAMCSRDWSRTTGDIRIDASAGGEIVYHGVSDMARKGLGLTFVDGFEVIGLDVVGGVAPKGINLFSAEIRNSRRGVIRGGRFSIMSGQQGADGIHFTGSCSDIELISVETGAGDDSVGLTVESPRLSGSVMERITLTRCRLGNEGHSSLKVLLASFAKGSVIRDVRLKDCDMHTRLAAEGAGVPIILANDARAGGGRVEDIVIEGGRTVVEPPPSRGPGLAALQLRSIDRLSLRNHDIAYFSRMAIIAQDCRDLEVTGGHFEPAAPVARNGQALFRLIDSPGHRIDLADKRPAWLGQAIIAESTTPKG